MTSRVRAPGRPLSIRSVRARILTLSLIAVVVTVVGVVVWGAVAAREVAIEGRAAAAAVDRLEGRLSTDGGLGELDVDGARSTADDAAFAAARADDAAGALPLRLASVLPFVGDDVRAVREVTGAVRLATSEALPPLLDTAEALDPEVLVTAEGGVDTVRLADAVPSAEAAASAASRAAEQVDGVDTGGLHPRVAEPVDDARAGLEELSTRTRDVSDLLAVLPGALGAEEPQEYLLAFQNLAEARPTGGIVGAWALLRLDAGRAEIVETGANEDLTELSGPARDLGPEVTALYGEDLALSQNVNLSPHWPDAAVLLSDLWAAQGRAAPDGVVGVDPVALSLLLGATGPVDVPGGPAVAADDVVDVVQARAYAEFPDQATRVAYLSAVTTTVFDAVLARGLASPDVLDAVTSAADAGHVALWSADPSLQALAERSGVAGVLPEPDVDAVRIHLTNVDGSKLDHYLRADVTCSGGDVVLGLSSSVPAEVPEYTQNQLDGAEPTTHRVVVDLLLPPTRGVASLDVSGAPTPMAVAPLRGWTVARATVDVPRDARTELRWTGDGAGSSPEVVVQPLTRPVEASACA